MANAPYVPPQMANIVIAQATQSAQSSSRGLPRAIGTCDLVENPAETGYSWPGGISATNAIGPLGALHNYFVGIAHQDVDLVDAKVSILSGPQHGKLETFGQGESSVTDYIADKGYYGPDRVIYQVTISGSNIRVVDSIHVVKVVTDTTESQFCPNDVWKIASTTEGAHASGILAWDYLLLAYVIKG
jgi:hypothetical protein